MNLSDTAGLRETNDTIEKIGIERTQSEIDSADIIINVRTPDDTPQPTPHPDKNTICVVNKSDLTNAPRADNIIYVSAKNGDGVSELTNAIREKISAIATAAQNGVAVNARTHGLLSDAASELKSAIDAPETNYDIFSEHTRRAADAIGKILGTITANDVLDATFSQLCLGK